MKNAKWSIIKSSQNRNSVALAPFHSSNWNICQDDFVVFDAFTFTYFQHRPIITNVFLLLEMNLTCGRAYSGFRDCITNDPTGSDIFTVEIQYSVLSIQNLHSITQSLTWTTWKQLRSLRRFERSTIVLLSYWPNQGSFKVGGSKSIYTLPDSFPWRCEKNIYPAIPTFIGTLLAKELLQRSSASGSCTLRIG
jgi:hypothetical protein